MGKNLGSLYEQHGRHLGWGDPIWPVGQFSPQATVALPSRGYAARMIGSYLRMMRPTKDEGHGSSASSSSRVSWRRLPCNPDGMRRQQFSKKRVPWPTHLLGGILTLLRCTQTCKGSGPGFCDGFLSSHVLGLQAGCKHRSQDSSVGYVCRQRLMNSSFSGVTTPAAAAQRGRAHQ